MVDISFAPIPFVTTFLFVFAIVFAMLTKTKIIEHRGSSVIIAAVFGFFTAIVPEISVFLQAILPLAALLLMVLFLLMFIQGLIQGNQNTLPMLVALALLLLVVGAVWGRIASMIPTPGGLSSDALLWIIGLVIVLLIFIVAYKQGEHYTTTLTPK